MCVPKTIIKRSAVVASCISLLLIACQSSGVSLEPAVLQSNDEQTIANLKSVLADALGVSSVEIGPGDLTTQSTISVLPPRPGDYENNSVAMPVIFNMFTNGDVCIIRRQNNGEEYPLKNIACESL
jgi:hypothetical protein